MTKPEAPCLNCEKSGTLHKRCQAYLDYKTDMEKFNAITRKGSEIERYFRDSIYRRAKEYNKRMHKKGW